ncbi:MAG: aminotransferase class I/II-fold pyridoxal phosphate-dependent enzyme [Verrucomicrobia bacterium]|nr:aminotransferase class I/II-fold pyridoxal phosphate-dependent enzyme [Verrucomicrobiota bacterium]
MSYKKINLAGDNWSPAHPAVLQAVIEANQGDAAAYGGDPWTREAEKLLQKTFRAHCKVFFVPNGTGANVLALRLACQSYESVLCSDMAHIECKEAGAAEGIANKKLLTVPHKDGKITPDAIRKRLRQEQGSGRHGTLPRLLSITQPTEIGTVYSLEELRALADLLEEENLLLHMDGSRLYNAAARLNASLADMVEASCVDILSLGGTKNGLMNVESVLIFNPSLEAGSDYTHKQTLQLVSKMRYLSAQYIPLLTNDLWRPLAEQANESAQRIASFLKDSPDFRLAYPVETNQIFFTAPPALIPYLQEEISCYLWEPENHLVRFVTSWDTSFEDVIAVGKILEALIPRVM